VFCPIGFNPLAVLTCVRLTVHPAPRSPGGNRHGPFTVFWRHNLNNIASQATQKPLPPPATLESKGLPAASKPTARPVHWFPAGNPSSVHLVLSRLRNRAARSLPVWLSRGQVSTSVGIWLRRDPKPGEKAGPLPDRSRKDPGGGSGRQKGIAIPSKDGRRRLSRSLRYIPGENRCKADRAVGRQGGPGVPLRTSTRERRPVRSFAPRRVSSAGGPAETMLWHRHCRTANRFPTPAQSVSSPPHRKPSEPCASASGGREPFNRLGIEGDRHSRSAVACVVSTVATRCS
jgi:hypothetical protein